VARAAGCPLPHHTCAQALLPALSNQSAQGAVKSTIRRTPTPQQPILFHTLGAYMGLYTGARTAYQHEVDEQLGASPPFLQRVVAFIKSAKTVPV